MIIAKNAGKDREPVPHGNHVARIYSIIHLGTNRKVTKEGPKDVDEVRIGFELPNETKEFKEGEGERPFTISQDYTLSMFEKANLRKLVEATLGATLTSEEADAYDVELLMGKTCLLNVVHKVSAKNGNTYANVSSASPVPKGMTVGPAVNTPFLLNYDNFSEEAFAVLPDFIRNKMTTSQEYKSRGNSVEEQYDRAGGEVDPDEVPPEAK